METVATDAGVNRFGSLGPAGAPRAGGCAGGPHVRAIRDLDDGVHAARYVDACLSSAETGSWESVEAPRSR